MAGRMSPTMTSSKELDDRHEAARMIWSRVRFETLCDGGEFGGCLIDRHAGPKLGDQVNLKVRGIAEDAALGQQI